MFVPFVGAVHQHLKSWSLGPVLQCLERFLEEPAFRRTLIQKPNAFTRPQGLYSLPVTLKTFLIQCLAQDHSCRTAVATAKDHGWLPPNASPGTAAYCRARDALAADGLQRAVEHTAQALDAGVSDEHLWMGRQSMSSMAPALPCLIPRPIKTTILSPHSKSPAAAFPSCVWSPSCLWPPVR